MYCDNNGNLMYPSFQSNLKAEGEFNHNNDMKSLQRKKNIMQEENFNSELFPSFSSLSNPQKNLLKTTYLKKISSLLTPNNMEPVKMVQDSNNQLI